MALEYVGGVTAVNTAGTSTYSVSLTSLTGGIASSAAEDDIVIVVAGWTGNNDGDPGVTTSGYTELCDLVQNDSQGYANCSVNYKVMGAAPDTSVTVKGEAVANGGGCCIHVWRGVDTATPIDVTTTTATGINARMVNSPAITPATSGCIILSAGWSTEDSNPATPALAEPSGFANKLQALARFGVGVLGSYDGWSSGSYDPAHWGSSGFSGFDCWVAATVALRPAAGGAPAPAQRPVVFSCT